MRESLAPLVAYYVSDHGYGHAAKSVAVIRTLIATDARASRPDLSGAEQTADAILKTASVAATSG